jgi:hypothetical protein
MPSEPGRPDYIVIRPAPGLPPGFLPPHLDGRWYDAAQIPELFRSHSLSDAVAVPSGRLEVRDSDGAVAEVYEVRP